MPSTKMLTMRREMSNMGGRNTSSGRTPPPAPMPPPIPTPPPTPPKPTPKPKPKPKPRPTPKPIQLDKMDDTQLASFVQQAKSSQLPRGFHDDITQRMILAAKWNAKPEVLPSSQVEALARKRGAVVLYRTNSDSRGGGINARQFSDGFRDGDEFSTGGSGGQAYGGGAYFSSSFRGSKGYGWGKADTIGAVLNKNAKVAKMSDLRGAAGIAWVNAHPKAAKRMGLTLMTLPSGRQFVASNRPRGSKGGHGCGYTSMAMAMGYNVVSNEVSPRETYFTVFDRSALTTSTKDYYGQAKGMR